MNLQLGINMLAKQLQVELTDLSEVENPVGRLEYLASKVVESAVRTLPPEAQMTYKAARPLIDGLFSKHLGQVSIRVPDEVRQLISEARAGVNREAA